jgi:tRNA-dihydrouridine synthase B
LPSRLEQVELGSIFVLNIGSIQLDVPFVQAALSGYSDLPMRRIARLYGAPFALSEVVLDRLVLQKGRKRKAILDVSDDDHPVGGQLMGADPDDFGPAAAAMAEAGYDVIDINFACPVKKVLGRRRGGFLLSQPDTALDIIRRVHDAVGATRPVTVKMRRGLDDTADSERLFFKILDGALAIGVSAITVHGRTVKQRYAGPSDWQFIAKVKEHAGDRVILGSGDLFSAEACLRMIRETGVDGVTIARGGIGNPWIFGECRALWRGDPLPSPPGIKEQGEAIARHFTEAVEVYGPRLAARIIRKFGIKYSEHHPCFRQVRDAFVGVKTPEDFQGVLERWYDPRADWPPVVRRKGHGDLVAAGATS